LEKVTGSSTRVWYCWISRDVATLWTTNFITVKWPF